MPTEAVSMPNSRETSWVVTLGSVVRTITLIAAVLQPLELVLPAAVGGVGEHQHGRRFGFHGDVDDLLVARGVLAFLLPGGHGHAVVDEQGAGAG